MKENNIWQINWISALTPALRQCLEILPEDPSQEVFGLVDKRQRR